MSLVTVVIPSYNHEKYIKQAIESVLNQSYENLELIVIDDGSKDGTLGYLQTVGDPRYTLIKQENSGAHNAINRGLSLSKGEYIAILNSDDVFHLTRLEECISRLRDGADLVATWIELIDDTGIVLGVKQGWKNMLPWAINSTNIDFDMSDEFVVNLLMSNFVSTTSNIVFTRKLYESVGGMRNLRFAHDWDFLLRAAQGNRCELIDKPLLQYRTHNTNTISSNRAWMLFEICWIYAVHLKYFTKKIFSNSKHGISDEVDFMAKSINLQGNEKVLWMLLQYLCEREMNGEDDPAMALMGNNHLRSDFIKYIKC